MTVKPPPKNFFDPLSGAALVKVLAGRDALFTGNLTLLMALEANGFDAEAGELVERVAIGLMRPIPRIVPASTSTLPKHERGRGAYDLRRFDRLTARLARPDLKKDRREATLKEREALEAAPKTAAEDAWRAAAADETIALATARGEESERLSTGAVRVNNRDALYSLVRRLTADQYDAGVEARACYEARTDDVGSQMGAQSFGGVHNNDAFVLARLQRAKKLQRIATIERAIAVECRAEPASLQMFRAVCGENKPLSVWGEGRAFERHLKALAGALDAAHGVIRGK